MEIKFEENVKKLKYFTKIDIKTWFVQSKKDSIMESFYVTLIPGGLVMSGDYDGVIVMPYTTSNEETIAWMSNATTLSYFCEKVGLGNQHHESKEYTEDKAMYELADEICSRYDIDYDMIDYFKSIFKSYTFDENELLEKLSLIEQWHPDSYPEERFDKICKAVKQVTNGTFEQIGGFHEICGDLESNCDFGDLWELDPTEYTSQIKWQHQCLLWWANNIRDKQDKEYFEV